MQVTSCTGIKAGTCTQSWGVSQTKVPSHTVGNTPPLPPSPHSVSPPYFPQTNSVDPNQVFPVLPISFSDYPVFQPTQSVRGINLVTQPSLSSGHGNPSHTGFSHLPPPSSVPTSQGYIPGNQFYPGSTQLWDIDGLFVSHYFSGFWYSDWMFYSSYS